MTDIKFEGFKINFDDYLFFSINKKENKVVIGGDFLPNDMHITFMLGILLKEFDLHLTRNIAGNVSLRIPVYKVAYTDMEAVMKLFIRHILRKTTLEKVVEKYSIFFPLPEANDEKYDELSKIAKQHIDALIQRKGESISKYKVRLDEAKISEIMKACGQQDAPLRKWFINNCYDVTVLSQFDKCAGFLFKQDKILGLFRLPFPDGNYEHFTINLDRIESEFTSFPHTNNGRKIFDHWHKAKNLLLQARTQEDLKDFKALRIKVNKKK